MKLLDPTTLSEWLPPHSLQWYEQLGKHEGKYQYSWNSTYTNPNGESIFDEEVARVIKNKKVLDVGCGHGDFTIQCAKYAKEIVGLDVTENFIKVGTEHNRPNVSFVVGNSKNGLPFGAEEFDCAYDRKGPTSVYPHLKRVVKKGGEILGLHPGDELGKELPILFPNLFKATQGTPNLDNIQQRFEMSHFAQTDVEVVNSIEYLHNPEDVIKYRCFGQHPLIYETLLKENLLEITRIFEQHAVSEGLPVTFSRYIVRAIV
ncbi:methyltransferase domain-containing protein [Neobacillus niacini]|uniref:methyltransferase domain-containing protein n=1 Tax=Neobacillus niacini TaxID=86668 RepID=UPI00300058AD